jgi:putative FmdB family regulatory protein
MPLIELQCDDCKHEFEDFYNAYNPKIEECPKCNSKNLTQLISMCKTKGSVELTGAELNASVKEATNKMRQRLHKDENFRANVIGEARFNKQVK